MAAYEIDPGMSVNEVMRRHPSTIAVFNALGIDARRDGVEPSVLFGALRNAAFRGAEVQR